MVQSRAMELGRPAAVLARRKSAVGQKKVLIGSTVILFALAYLVYFSMQGTTMYYLTVGELLDRGGDTASQQVRVAGKVQPGSITREDRNTTVRFVALDEKDPGRALRVVYRGVIPDTFKDDAEAVFEGKLTPEGVFQANVLLAKCPSKYEGATGDAEHDQQHLQ
ncbi:MAG: cytochrome c maturation protein CcmE [Chloroflexi bacterium]|nr:cytochrome c maturation protein CcmE [Chloroflexota bacterium]